MCVHVYIIITAMALECVTYDHDSVNWSKQLQHCNSHQEHATQLQHHNLGAWILHTKSTLLRFRMRRCSKHSYFHLDLRVLKVGPILATSRMQPLYFLIYCQLCWPVSVSLTEFIICVC